MEVLSAKSITIKPKCQPEYPNHLENTNNEALKAGIE
jgi:hypothetical protein